MNKASKRISSGVKRILNYSQSRAERRYGQEAAAGKILRIEDIEATLDHLGIVAGDRVFVHSRTAILGQVEGGLIGILETLKQRVGPGGMILMPTFPYRGSFWEYAQTDPLFDVRRTPSHMGWLTELFRRRHDVHRSLHPTHPVAIWGNQAREWVQDHESDPLPFHELSPFGRLYRRGGKILFMELSGIHLTQVHVAEAILRDSFPAAVYLQPTVQMRVIGSDGRDRTIPVLLHDPCITSRVDPRVFYPELEKTGIVRRYMLRGYIPFVVIDGTPFIRFLIEAAHRGVTVYNRTTLTGWLKGLASRRFHNSPHGQLLPSRDCGEDSGWTKP